ncbi:ABC transporter ATP-binding protein [Solibacillus daqui]|uniref:ABC transporter ATP-binding protein n=1 Tax=Solibacillus daqui TaxID=2912187 RepID=UPI002364FF67|nr:ABC transporter ATP-binding protein [Solibacillus daqui]
MVVSLQNVTYAFEKHSPPVILKLNMEIKQGEFVSIIGRSGTGKSTIFKLMTGLLTPDEGSIVIDDRQVAPGDVGFMPQKDLLLPWRTILENVMIAAEIQKNVLLTKEEAIVWIERVGLKDYVQAYPKELSGGMRQRAAFLRALLTGKDVLLLDEPFGALDAFTKKEMQSWLLSMWQQLKKTVLFITHDLEEAILLSDRILILHQDKSVEEIIVDLPRPRANEMSYSEAGIALRRKLERKISSETD